MHSQHFNARINMKTIKNQKNSDSDNKYQSKDFHLSMSINEIRNAINKDHHNNDSNHDRNDHDD